MKRFYWSACALALLALAGCGPTGGSEGESTDAADAVETAAPAPAGDVTFASAVQPIIEAKCAGCHIDDAKSGLSLASLESALEGGKKGPDVVPGDAEGSPLYLMVAGLAEKRMPPKGDPLSDDEIATIKSWIDGGAK